MQVLADFALMFEETAAQKIEAKSQRICYQDLQYGGYKISDPPMDKEMFLVLEVLDKSVRPSGPGLKSPPIFHLTR